MIRQPWLAALTLVGALAAPTHAQEPMTGFGTPELDAAMQGFMSRHDVPGVSLAIAVDERLVVARGYGFSNVAQGQAAQPDSLFRVASISKPITAISSLKLVESGHLDLDQPVLPQHFSRELALADAGRRVRLESITLAHLLNHTSGWQFRDLNRDVVFEDRQIARLMNRPSPPGPDVVIEHVFTRERVHVQPGISYRYDNFNFMVAGRTIESATARGYEDFVRSRILAPLGIRHARVGHSLEADRLPGEVLYYTRGTEAINVPSVFDSDPGLVPIAYGGWDQNGIDSVGGWVTSAPDLVRLMAAIDGHPVVSDLITPDTRERLGRNPGLPVFSPASSEWYALGWGRDDGGDTWFHDGSLPGTRTAMIMLESGLLVAVLTNARFPNDNPYFSDLSNTLSSTINATTNWPDRDLFQDLGYQDFIVSDEISGAWFDLSHDGEGFLIEVLDANRAVVYWFTYDGEGNQRWLLGTGEIRGDEIIIGTLSAPQGGRFGNLSNEITFETVGSLSITFDDCHQGVARYEVDGEPGEQQLTRLVSVLGRDCPDPGDPVVLTRDAARTVSGSWFDLADPGEGFIAQQISDDLLAAFWFTFDESGNQRWMTGVGERTEAGWRFDEMTITTGGVFGSEFDPADIVRTPWGSLELSLACNGGQADYVPALEDFSEGSQSLIRLTFLAGLVCVE